MNGKTAAMLAAWAATGIIEAVERAYARQTGKAPKRVDPMDAAKALWRSTPAGKRGRLRRKMMRDIAAARAQKQAG